MYFNLQKTGLIYAIVLMIFFNYENLSRYEYKQFLDRNLDIDNIN